MAYYFFAVQKMSNNKNLIHKKMMNYVIEWFQINAYLILSRKSFWGGRDSGISLNTASVF